MEPNLLLIKSYYQKIDDKDVQAVMALFSEQADYVRADRYMYGKKEIEYFYQHERNLDGSHTINQMYPIRDMVIVQGVFTGTNGRGEDIEVGFSDFFRVKDNQIIHRHTYLGKGAEMVQ